jgi:uncharacterized protein (DUF697 family)
MTPDQKSSCHKIIHSCTAGGAAGNLIPIPGVGIAADVVAMTAMTMGLAGVFGGSLTEEAAKGLAITAIKDTMLRQPIRTLTKELSKFIPFVGQIVGPSISAVMLEAAGWSIAKDLDRKFATSIAGS